MKTRCPFPHAWLITGFVTRLTRQVSLVEQELLTLPQHLSSPPVFSGVRVTRSLVLYVCFVDRCLSFCTFSFCHCVVCSSSIYGFWLPLWHSQTLLKVYIRVRQSISSTHSNIYLIVHKTSLSYYYYVNVPRSEQSILVTVCTEIKKYIHVFERRYQCNINWMCIINNKTSRAFDAIFLVYTLILCLMKVLLRAIRAH